VYLSQQDIGIGIPFIRLSVRHTPLEHVVSKQLNKMYDRNFIHRHGDHISLGDSQLNGLASEYRNYLGWISVI